MSEKSGESEHLTPELFVDVLEKAPVEASRLRHLESCAECAAELRELEDTLRLLREAPRAGARRPYAVWLAAAAVLILAVTFLFRASPPATAPDETLLLPPAQMDDGFQLLVALSRELGESGTADALEQSGALVSPELADLSDEERAALVERLAAEVLETESSS